MLAETCEVNWWQKQLNAAKLTRLNSSRPAPPSQGAAPRGAVGLRSGYPDAGHVVGRARSKFKCQQEAAQPPTAPSSTRVPPPLNVSNTRCPHIALLVHMQMRVCSSVVILLVQSGHMTLNVSLSASLRPLPRSVGARRAIPQCDGTPRSFFPPFLSICSQCSATPPAYDYH